MRRRLARLFRLLRRSSGHRAAQTTRSLSSRDPLVALPEWRIPSNLFQTTVTKIVDERLWYANQEFHELNPGLAVHVFDDVDMDTYMEASWGHHSIFDVYQRARFGQMKADIFRYCVVFDKGGYYCDINKAVRIGLRDLHLPDSDGLISFEQNECVIFPESQPAALLEHPSKLVLQWAFGFSRHHPVLKNTIENVVRIAHQVGSNPVHSVRDGILMTTGPGVFTASVRDCVSNHALSHLAQLGIDFGGAGIFRLAGAHRLAHQKDHYTRKANEPLFRSDFS